MKEYFSIFTDTGLRATFPFTNWATYLRYTDGSDLGGHKVLFCTTLYLAEDMVHAIRRGRKTIDWYLHSNKAKEVYIERF